MALGQESALTEPQFKFITLASLKMVMSLTLLEKEVNHYNSALVKVKLSNVGILESKI